MDKKKRENIYNRQDRKREAEEVGGNSLKYGRRCEEKRDKR
jgi:hypothetical protein